MKTVEEKVTPYIHNVTIQIGSFIREQRKSNSLTIAELSKRAKVSSTVIVDLENGRSLPRVAVLLKIAFSLDVEPTILFQQFLLDSPIKLCPPTKNKTELIDIIQQEGLAPVEAKEVIEFIKFKKGIK